MENNKAILEKKQGGEGKSIKPFHHSSSKFVVWFRPFSFDA